MTGSHYQLGIYGVIQMRNVNLMTWIRVAAIEMVPEVEFGVYYLYIYIVGLDVGR